MDSRQRFWQYSLWSRPSISNMLTMAAGSAYMSAPGGLHRWHLAQWLASVLAFFMYLRQYSQMYSLSS